MPQTGQQAGLALEPLCHKQMESNIAAGQLAMKPRASWPPA
jgi:hypothetical protein